MVEKDKTLRVLLWAPFGAGEHYWGPGTSAFRLYQRREKYKFKLSLVHASNRQGLFPDVFDEQIKLTSLEKPGILAKLEYFAAAKKWIRENNHRFDVFHGLSAFEYTFKPALSFSKSGKSTFIKITSENSGFGQNSFISRLSGIARKRIKNANNITGYIAVNSSIEENLINHGINENKIIKIPNGVDERRFSPVKDVEKVILREKLNIKNRKTLLFLGGINEVKRAFDCVLAVQKLIKLGYDIQFYIVGPDRSRTGQLLKKIKDYVLNNDLGNWISFIAETTIPEVYYRISDIFLLPSKSEGMPNSLLEAMSCGLACIVTPIPGCRDLVTDQINGIFTNGNYDDIADKIKLLLDSNDLINIYGGNARNLICEKYSSKEILRRHIDVFSNEVLSVLE